MNTDALEWALMKAERRVLEIQAKLHQWAIDDSHRKFDDLYNLVTDPAFLLVSWDRVQGNRGARTAGVDGKTVRSIEDGQGVEAFLDKLRSQLKDFSFRPVPVRERMIPKANGKKRRLGIPTVADRVAQAALKLVLEPIFEADFLPCSYGFRPNRRAHDALAETRLLTTKHYEWVVEGDIKACFDEISHTALMDRVRNRIKDKRALDLVKAFLKSGILSQDGRVRDTNTGTPQGGILSPLLANIALSVLDEHVASMPGGPNSTRSERAKRKYRGLGNYRLIRYADDFLVLVSGTRDNAEAVRNEVASVLTPMGLTLSEEKTFITHIDEGFDFLGWHIQRHPKRGTDKRHVYNYPSKKALMAVKEKVKKICRKSTHLSMAALLHQLNPVLRGWTAYFRPGVSKSTFQYLGHYTWTRVFIWARRKHKGMRLRGFRRMYCSGGWVPASERGQLYQAAEVTTTRYRFRGYSIPTPWTVAA
ncbi:group II intron reverse transcriptase/maturase [Streptomyces noursei]|uniref:group II intron reverse transcriptase/maturase n=1 Tax=Streptomyces noursei TaxID=1971 RepID=UPI00196428F8|nr:group II intron reverse transcriptase/maturase [Streptomyces noursei]QRX95640.1 group II intron reverse transcriptase/maturase [Streptomyces noursei]